MFRPLLCLAVIACIAGSASCRSGTDTPRGVAGSPLARASSSSPVAPPAPVSSCPSAGEFVKAMAAKGWGRYRVTSRIVCAGGWATTAVKVTTVASDPARAVLRNVGGRWRAITYGTDGLCDAPGMRPAPVDIKKALGPYC